MKILIFGGTGKIGSAVAWDLVKQEAVKCVGLVGRRRKALLDVKKWVGSNKIVTHSLDITDKRQTQQLMQKYDVGVNALPDRRTSYSVFHAAAEAGFSLVDMLEEYHQRPDAYELEGLKLPKKMTLNKYGDWLHETAKKSGATLLDGIGFAPGLSNITVGEAIRKLDVAESAIARVGGIPCKEASLRHPLKYMITWAFWHVLREYMVKLYVRKDGKVVEVDALTDRERFRFQKFGQDEELTCAVTPGMPSFIYTRPQLKEFAEKTVRWPGHFDAVDELKKIGLLDTEPVKYDGMKVVPRDFLLSMIEPRLRAKKGETDVCVMYNTVVGTKDGRKTRIEHFMWDVADTKNNISSMARVTGFPSAIAAMLIASGDISQKGIVAPEDAFVGSVYNKMMEALKKRNIDILEETQVIG